MKTLRRILAQLTGWAKTREHEERLRAEIEDHVLRQTADNIRAGLPPVEARRQALLKFGAMQAIREDYRDQQKLPFVEVLVQDTRYALRRLRKSPAFSITTILTLALGIGATTSVFTLVHAVLLKSLPVAKPGELYRVGKQTHCCVWGGFQQYNEFSLFSHQMYRYFRDHTQGFAELAAFQAGNPGFGIRRAGTRDLVQSYPGEFVSGNYFAMFGVGAWTGRTIIPRDDEAGAQPVAVMSYRLWHDKYGSDPSILGSTFDVNGKPFTIVGITPPGFFGDTMRSTQPDFFFPIATESLVHGELAMHPRPDIHWLELIGRIRPGANPASIEAQMRVELKQWLRSHWGEMDDNARANLDKQTLYITPGGAGITSMRDYYEHWLHILMWVTACLLLIVCANIANLMLVRGLEARHQTSLSIALGARPERLVRQTLTESTLLALLGGAAGLAVAFAGTRLILHFAFMTLPGMAGVPISPSPSMPVLWFALAVSLITGVAFGVAPAWMTTRVDPIEALRGANRSTSRSNLPLRKMLVIVQAALSLVLLAASGLLTAALHNLEHQDFGFEQNRRIVASFDPALAGYHAAQMTELNRRIHDSVAALPGVAAVALCNYSPQSGDSWNDGIFIDGHPAPGPNDDNGAGYERVSAGYFEVVGTPILRGRGITEQDTNTSRHVAVINEALARKFFPHEDALGKHFGRSEPGAARQYEIVGISKDARYLTYDLDRPVGPFVFLPANQFDVFSKPELTEGDLGTHFMHDVVIVTQSGVNLTAGEIRRAFAAADPNVPVTFVRTMRDQVAGQFSQQRLMARLSSFFGILSLVLASIGLYGLTAFNAGRRTNEIGVRMALGAGRSDVVALVLRGALGLVVVGLVLGLPLTVAAGRFLGNQLYGMSPYNPLVIIASVLSLGVSAFVAALIPAFRASSISPLDALRAE